jgi:CheY-like chemotaxis protein
VTARRSRILLVEDEALNRALVRAILARAAVAAVRDAELVEASSLAQAREQLRAGGADVVLLDMVLPDGSGLTLAREITGRDGTSAPGNPGRRPTVIAVTGGVLPEDRAAASAAGCDGFLDKPYAAGELVALLAAHLPAD